MTSRSGERKWHSRAIEKEREKTEASKWLTFDIEMEDVALCFPFTVGCRASVATGAVAAHALQHQALVGRDDAHRNVVTQLLFLSE